MRKLTNIILLMLILTGIVHCQGGRTWFTPKQQKTLDSLDAAISALSLGSSALATGKIFIGDATGVAYPRTTSGDITLSTTGVFGISPLAIVNADISASAAINPSKIDGAGHTISTSEFGALDGVTANIQEQIDGFIVGTGFLATSGGTMTGNINAGDNIKLNLGSSNDLQVYHSGTYAWFYNTTGEMHIRNVANAKMSFATNNIERWNFSGNGHLLPFVTNSYNIGSTMTQPDTIYTRAIIANGVNIGTVLGTHSTTTAIKQLISDSLLTRKLDPMIFAKGYPQTGDIIGPFRVHRDLTIDSEYLYVEGTSGGTITYNVFYATTVNKNAVAGSGSEIPLFTSNEVGAITSGVQVDSDNSNIYEATPDEGEWIWCKIVAVSGTITRFSLTLNKSGR